MKTTNVLAACVAILLAFGLVMVYSTSAVRAEHYYENSYYFAARQLAWIAISLVGFFLMRKIDYHTMGKYSKYLLGFSFVTLLVVLIPGVGVEVNGARRWLRFDFLPLRIGFQPSEMTKLVLVIYMADVLSRKQRRIREFLHGFLPPVIVLVITALLIVVEPDFGTACFIGIVIFGMLWIAGIRIIHVMPMALVVLPVAVVMAFLHFSHVRDRILTWWKPEADASGKAYQVNQSLIALGSGGPFGRGLGASRQKLLFLPCEHSDFIVSIVGEEAGFLGTSCLVLLFVLFVWKGFRVACGAPDLQGFLLASGIVIAIALQAAVNISVVTAFLPAKGISLPFVSFGGSGLLFAMMGVGALFNVASHGAAGRAPVPGGAEKL